MYRELNALVINWVLFPLEKTGGTPLPLRRESYNYTFYVIWLNLKCFPTVAVLREVNGSLSIPHLSNWKLCELVLVRQDVYKRWNSVPRIDSWFTQMLTNFTQMYFVFIDTSNVNYYFVSNALICTEKCTHIRLLL